jgi:hypothetical protein
MACAPMVILAYRSLRLVIELLKLLVIGVMVEEESKLIVREWSACRLVQSIVMSFFLHSSRTEMFVSGRRLGMKRETRSPLLFGLRISPRVQLYASCKCSRPSYDWPPVNAAV